MKGLIFAVVVSLLVVPELQAQFTGTQGDDNLVVHAISGEPSISQAYEDAGTGAVGPNGETLRADDQADPVNPETRTYFDGQPFDLETVKLRGKGGADEFLIRTYISGKPAIVRRHVDATTGVINWNGVAGENDNVHDHWVEYFGDVDIKDFDADEGDTIRVQGHTVALHSLLRTKLGTYIVVQSQQGNGGGAHDEDILGYIFVKKAQLVEADITFTAANDGIVETWEEFLELVAFNEAMAGD